MEALTRHYADYNPEEYQIKPFVDPKEYMMNRAKIYINALFAGDIDDVYFKEERTIEQILYEFVFKLKTNE